MEALSQGFAEQKISKSKEVKKKNVNSVAETSSCWVLIDSESQPTITNKEIVLCINEHHKSLDDKHEVGVKIEHLGKEVTFYIDHIAHQNQAMIYFKGQTQNGRLVHFVKPASELKIELQSLQRRASDRSKIPFGFADWDAYEKFKLANS